MSDSEAAGLILDTVYFAAEAHRGQRRKGSDASPYINHPIQVAHLIWDVGEVRSLAVLQAALLHDTIEDAGEIDQRKAAKRRIEDRFGSIVCSLVLEVTDDKELPKEKRKQLQIEHAPNLSWQAKLIKLADKISNVKDIIENPPMGWDTQRKRDYVDWAEKVVAGLRGTNERLEKCFDELVAKARKEID